jgi:hypothetical protein
MQRGCEAINRLWKLGAMSHNEKCIAMPCHSHGHFLWFPGLTFILFHQNKNVYSSFLQIAIFNPLGWGVLEPVALPVSSSALVVRSAANASVPATVLPADPARSRQIVQNRESVSVADFTLHFNADVPAFGFAFYTVSNSDFREEADASVLPTAKAQPQPSSNTLDDDFLVIGNDYLTLSFSRHSNLLSSITDVQRNVTLSCSQQLMYYEAEGHLLVDFKHKRCLSWPLYRCALLILVSGTALVPTFSYLATTPQSLLRVHPLSLWQVRFPLRLLSFDDEHRGRIAWWSAGSEAAVCLVGRNHLSLASRNGSR